MARLRPHQKPILTRFALVMPVRKQGEIVVPCEPDDAEAFRLLAYRPRTATFDVVETFNDYALAREEAVLLDIRLAYDAGVKR